MLRFLNRLMKFTALLAVLLFVGLNIIAAFHAYRFTHYSNSLHNIPEQPERMSLTEKIKALVFGVSLPRPENDSKPRVPYITYRIKHDSLECWELKPLRPKGNIILFHGYGNRKCAMLDRAHALHRMGYRVVLCDFSGSGGSKGNATTIGYREAADVKACYDTIMKRYPGQPLFLLGCSMGAAAVMKSVKDHALKPTGLILECPFGSMYNTVCNRFDAMKLPSFPMAAMLVFYGGLLNEFYAFDHNPMQYASFISCPVLLQYGGRDERVDAKELDILYHNLKGKKKRIIYPEAGHESYLSLYNEQWKKDMNTFLASTLK